MSGTIPIAERPDGRRLLADAAAGRFEEIWVYKVDRLGRDAVDLLVVRRRLDALGIALVLGCRGSAGPPRLRRPGRRGRPLPP